MTNAALSDAQINDLARQAGLPMSWLDDGKASAWRELLAFARAVAAITAGDTARLDWLSDLHDFKVSAKYALPDGPVLVRLIRGDNRIGAGPSLRAAIDAAMQTALPA